MPRDELSPPERDAGDTAHALAIAAIAAVPMVGGSAAQLVEHFFGPPLEERRAIWMDVVADVIRELQAERGVDVAVLRSDPVFLDAVIKATHAALRTRSDLKREALRSAIANTALRQPETELVQEMFLGFVEDLTEMHLRILTVMGDPGPAARERGVRLEGTTPAQVLELLIPELRGRRDIYDQLWSDLRRRSLVAIENLHVMMSDVGGTRATALGRSFLDFLRSPFNAADER